MDLRFTDTNAADDTAGRAFGLEGNLYLPVVGAAVGGLALLGILGFGLHCPWSLTGAVAALPFGLTLSWVLLLRHGKPAGYDRDWVEHRLGEGNFGPFPARQPEVLS